MMVLQTLFWVDYLDSCVTMFVRPSCVLVEELMAKININSALLVEMYTSESCCHLTVSHATSSLSCLLAFYTIPINSNLFVKFVL